MLFSEQTFEEVRSFNFRTWYLWAGLLGIVVAVIAAMVGLLSIDPIRTMFFESKRYVPPEELIALREKVIELEDRARAQNLYIVNLRQLLSGQVIQDSAAAALTTLPDSIYTVDRIEEDELLRESFDLEEQISPPLRERNLSMSNNRPLEQLYLVPPLTGAISLGFDVERNHLGIDINAPKNTPVKATLGGHIIYSDWSIETGNTIGIQHDHGIISFYKHNSALLKKTGSYVEAGEAVAIIGNTGTLSSGPHLHFELWVDGKPMDPTRYINF